MECEISPCYREAEGNFCQSHLNITKELETSFKQWKYALGGKFSLEMFYEELQNEELKTGKWVLEIIEHIKANEGKFHTPCIV